jgi:hypothetical protein
VKQVTKKFSVFRIETEGLNYSGIILIFISIIAVSHQLLLLLINIPDEKGKANSLI